MNTAGKVFTIIGVIGTVIVSVGATEVARYVAQIPRIR